MKFNLTYGPDIASAPDGFKATVEAVAAFFESSFTDPVTINVKVERGLSGGLLGHSDYALTGPYTFAQITTALAQETHSGSDVIALAHLPTVDPISGTHAYYMTSAQAKALGLQGPSDALDCTVQFANNPPFDYDRSDGITPGSYDFYGTVAHELSEVMGRELNAIGNEVQTGKPNGYYPSICSSIRRPAFPPSSEPPRVISRRTAASPTWTTSTPIPTTTSAIGLRARVTTLFAPSATPASSTRSRRPISS
jgi:hypothetical protein